ncbi:MAG: ribosomal protein L7/L12 [Chthonomonadales bacterium]|nr:ribosomal protein L7/L12 [Chthonomonadales bacterium]
MAPSVTTRSDVLEREYDAGMTLLIRGSVATALGALGVWLFRLFDLWPLMYLFGAVMGIGVVTAGWGALRMARARSLPAVTFHCPYCDHPMSFLAEPTEDFDCERCHRRVYFEDGKPVPVHTITCTVCKAEHRVSEKVTTYTCDRCNRALKLVDPKDPQAIVAEKTDVLQNYDVLLTQAGRSPNDVAMALQSLLVCNLRDARKQMESLPLTVTRNVAERKADAIRRRLRELGATAVIRPTVDDQAPASGRRT